MIPCPAQYLLRFDDLCPTQARERWERFLPLMADHDIRPILAIVPDNRDPELDVSPPHREFWAQMRRLQGAGAAVGLHGFRHLCASRGRSLVPLHPVSEFAGVPEAIQRQWIREGLEILRDSGLHPTVWVAPRHGFDRATLRALRAEEIRLVSDGFARRPFARGGMTWIPQQLWQPAAKKRGLWTICVHANTATDEDITRLKDFLRVQGNRFTSVARIAANPSPPPLALHERVEANAAVFRYRARALLTRFVGRA